jgi:hypothetical protein
MLSANHNNNNSDTAGANKRYRDSGASTVEVLGWAAMSTVAIVAIGGALQVLGLDLINNVRTQLGL